MSPSRVSGLPQLRRLEPALMHRRAPGLSDGEKAILPGYATNGQSLVNSVHAPAGKLSQSGIPDDTPYTATIVMGRLDKEALEMQWVHDELQNITGSHIYIVDDPTTYLPHLDKNHGREARVYLEYIISHYHELNDITFFWHVAKKVWHNNILLDWDSAKTINRMNRGNIVRQGYVPSRCDAWPGCPAWIKFDPSQAEHQLDPHRLADMFSPKLFEQLFPGETEFPPYFAGTCCSQFAASRDAIHSRPVETYKALLKFVIEYWSDQHAGMVFELLWPFIFLGKGTLCPSMQECYCRTYDVCLEDKEINMIEQWNGWRGRRDELNWQVWRLEDEFRRKLDETKSQKGDSTKDGPKEEEDDDDDDEEEPKIEDDPSFGEEYKRIKKNFGDMSVKVKTLQQNVVSYFQLSEPPVDW